MLPFPPSSEPTFEEAIDILLEERVIDCVTASLTSDSWHPSIRMGAMLQLNRDVYSTFMWVENLSDAYILAGQDWTTPLITGQTEEEALKNGLIRAAANIIKDGAGG